MKIGVIMPLFKSKVYTNRIIANIKKIDAEYGGITFYLRDDSGDLKNNSESLLRRLKDINISFKKNQKNEGECFTTNILFEEAYKMGVHYALLLHQDDIYVNGWIQFAKKFLVQNRDKKNLILFGKYINGTTKQKYQKCKKNEWHEKPSGEAGIKYLAQEWYWQISGAVISVPLWINSKGMNQKLKYCGDNDLAVKMLENEARPFISNKTSIQKETFNNSSSRVFRSDDAAIGWSYLMIKYANYRTNKETAENILRCLKTYLSRKNLKQNSLHTTLKSTVILIRTLFFLYLKKQNILPLAVRNTFCEKR